MSKLIWHVAAVGALVGCLAIDSLGVEPPRREIFVPFADLHVILNADAQRVFMSREEYESLAAQAREATRPHEKKQPLSVLSADYTATIEENRARLLGKLVFDAPDNNVSAVELDLSGVSLRRAALDGKPAPLGRNGAGLPVLFISGAGRHELELDIFAPLETSAAQRTLSFQIPTPPATRLRLTVPGNVDIRSGATVISRTADEAKPETVFELLPKRGQNSLVLSLNNRQLQKDRVIVAHAVLVDEITSAFERLRATVSMSLLHGAAEQFRFVVPEGFEVTNVLAPEVSRWAVTAEDGRRVLDVRLREPATGTVSLGILAIRTPAAMEPWRWPKLLALDVAGQATVIGLFLEKRLTPSELLPQNLISIDASILAQTMSDSSTEHQAGAPALTAVAAYYAPQADYDLTAKFSAPPADLRVLTNVLLTIEDKSLSARGGFVLSNMTENLLDFDFIAPALWQVTEVTPDGGTPLPVENYPMADGGTRVHVRLPQAVAIGQSKLVYFRAVSTPDGWLDEWQTKRIAFGVFQVLSAARDVGAIAVQSRDDMIPHAEEIERLTPLDANEKSRYGLEDVPTDLAYRYDASPYVLNLSIARVAPRITARALSFFRVEPDLLTVHGELVYNVTEARTNRLSFALPDNTPAEVAIGGLDGVVIKESTSVVADGIRRWTVLLAEPDRGTIRLAIDFQQPLSDQSADVALPLVRALDVVYQSGIVSVEGDTEHEVQVKTVLRKVDVGELAEADFQPGRRLLGAFGYVGDSADVTLAISRHVGHQLPPAIVERAELVTMVSASGRAQTAARFQLRAKAQMIELRLPVGSTLWSAHLDGQPTLPQREGESLLINLPASAEAKRRDVQLVYESPLHMLGLSSTIDLSAPELLLRGDVQPSGQDVPLADLIWQLSTPSGFLVVRSQGTVYAEPRAIVRSPLWVVVQTLRSLFVPAVQAARDAAPTSQTYSKRAAEPVPAPVQLAQPSGTGSPEPDGLADQTPAAEPTNAETPTPAQAPTTTLAKSSQWALEGLRSLPIELQTSGLRTTFQSLGESPRLRVTVVDRRRFDLLAWAVGLLVVVRGVQLTGSTRGRQFRYLIIVMVVALAMPLALPWGETLAPLCEMAFFAACSLVPYYLMVAMLKWLVRFGRNVKKDRRRLNVTAATVTLLLLFAAQHTLAEEPLVPIVVPADAIIVPYDADKEDPLQALDPKVAKPFGAEKSRTILVPYASYVEMRKATRPEGKPLAAPPAEYALAGAAFTTKLDGGESLVVEGHLDIDVLVERAVSIPIGLDGGVLTKATIDGTLDATIVLAPEAQPAAAPLRLLVAGLGRKRLDLAMRFRLQQRGGWQIAEGRLPVAPATALTLEVANSGTEVTFSGGVERGMVDTRRDNETIETALTADGAFHVQWRVKAGAAPVDQSLTAQSAMLLDVQEDGLRLMSRYDLGFRRGQRESFTIDVPDGYLVEKVNGANVRGWQLVETDGSRRLEVTLLKAAQGSESFSISLSRRGAVGGQLTEFTVPMLNMQGAAEQSGEVRIRRSPLLELRTEQTIDVSRADNTTASADPNAETEESPLGIVPYQAYRFATLPFTIRLSSRPVTTRVSAELQTVLKISQRQRTLESRIRVSAQDRPVYRLRIALPDQWKLDRVTAPEPFEWVAGDATGRRTLSLYFATGQRQPFDVILSGVLGDYSLATNVALPRIEVVNADELPGPVEQSGEIVIQADPSLNVRAEELQNCDSELLAEANTWLAPAQQRLARLALRYRRPDYAAEIQLSPRTPSVHCDTITNIRVTQRAIEETVLLEFNVQEAGIRSLSFLLPESMRDARVSVPMLRQKTLEPVADDPAQRVRVVLELQDEVMDNLRVLIENDRLMTADDYIAPIPTVETGQTDHRYVTLESAGRDEILVTAQTGVEPLGREQAEWRMLTDVLGRGLTQAYLVAQNEAQPLLVLKAKDRAAVETAAARIGLAKVTLIFDANGAYRGEQLYRVDNSLEQYLEIQLPRGMRLWTAHVAGEPVKPVATATADVVRVPLVKTAPGDADYAVVLKYGGELRTVGWLDRVELPLIRTLNIHVELSQAEVHMPATHRWFNFSGTMRLVTDEGDLAADWLAYNTRQMGLAMSSVRSSDAFTKARARSNLKGLQAQAEELKKRALSYRGNKQLDEQLESNTAIQQGLQVELEAEQSQTQTMNEIDNRLKLRERFDTQSSSRASDVVSQAGENFDVASDAKSVQPSDEGQQQGQAISDKWLSEHKLDQATAKEPTAMYEQSAANAPDAANQSTAQAAPLQDYGRIQRELGDRQANGQEQDVPTAGDEAQRQLRRYEERIAQQQPQGPAPRDMPTDNLSTSEGATPFSLGGAAMSGYGGSRDGGTAGRGYGAAVSGSGSGVAGGGGVPATAPAAEQPPLAGPEKPAALASLDVELHPRGVKYAFTTPRGDVAITARAVSRTLVDRLIRLGLLALGVLLIVAIARTARRY